MFGDPIHPFLVTYHNDSLVSYKYALMPKDSTLRLFGKTGFENIFKVENYKWHTRIQTYQYNKDGIGEQLNGELYIFHPFKLLDTGIMFNSYNLTYDERFEQTFLYKNSFKIVEHFKINGSICNCFNSDRYIYNGDFKKIDLSKRFLEGINTGKSMLSEDSNLFVWDDYCTMGVIRTCFLTGIGTISIGLLDEQKYSNSYTIPLVFLESKCKDFFKNRLNLNIQQER